MQPSHRISVAHKISVAEYNVSCDDLSVSVGGSEKISVGEGSGVLLGSWEFTEAPVIPSGSGDNQAVSNKKVRELIRSSGLLDASLLSNHNISGEAHNDIRNLVAEEVRKVLAKVGVIQEDVSEIDKMLSEVNSTLENKANDADVVKLTGDQTISGVKRFEDGINTNGVSFAYKADLDTGGAVFAFEGVNPEAQYVFPYVAEKATVATLSDIPDISGKADKNKAELGEVASASGNFSTALGDNSTASGIFSTALGYCANAMGAGSVALGEESVAYANSAVAIGYNSMASGSYSIVLGDTATAGYRSTALGPNSTASGAYSTALGSNSKASGNYSTASGGRSTASGEHSAALGDGSTASGGRSTALGPNSTTSGEHSTALGDYSTASGGYSIALGSYSTASGTVSTALGDYSTASGYYSTAVGTSSFASKENEHVFGSGASGLPNSTALVITNSEQLSRMRIVLETSPIATFDSWFIFQHEDLINPGNNKGVRIHHENFFNMLKQFGGEDYIESSTSGASS